MIETDPEHRDFRVVSGAMRKIEETPETAWRAHQAERERRTGPGSRFREMEYAHVQATSVAEGARRVAGIQREATVRAARQGDVLRDLRGKIRAAKKAEGRRGDHARALGVAGAVTLLPTTMAEREVAAEVAAAGLLGKGGGDEDAGMLARRRVARESVLPGSKGGGKGQKAAGLGPAARALLMRGKR